MLTLFSLTNDADPSVKRTLSPFFGVFNVMEPQDHSEVDIYVLRIQ